MKNKTINILVTLGCFLFFLTPIAVHASEYYEFFFDEYDTCEKARMDKISNMDDATEFINKVEENVPLSNNVVPYSNCVDCSELGVLVCAKEATFVGTSEHRYGLTLQNTCTVYYYVSHGAEMCPNCWKVLYQGGQHDCWERHKGCSKGDYDVCPMTYS